MFPILNPRPSSLPVPSLWVIPVHQPQASSIVHQTWTGDSFRIWYYTCFNAILPNHPTLSLSHRVQKTVLYISRLSRIQGYCYHISKFHIYALVYCIGVLLSGLLHSVCIHPKGYQSWVFIGCWNSNTLATSCKELTHWKRPWFWEGLGAGGEGDDRGWDGWMASLTQWIWVWVNFGSWWWTGRPDMLRFMGLQRVGHIWATEMNLTGVSFLVI